MKYVKRFEPVLEMWTWFHHYILKLYACLFLIVLLSSGFVNITGSRNFDVISSITYLNLHA